MDEGQQQPTLPTISEPLEPDDFSDCIQFHPESNTYSLVMRWKPISRLEMYGLSKNLSGRGTAIEHIDLGHTGFGFSNLIFSCYFGRSSALDAEGMIGLSHALRPNMSVKSLDLGNNKLGTLGAHRLAACLLENTTLELINLEWNLLCLEAPS